MGGVGREIHDDLMHLPGVGDDPAPTPRELRPQEDAGRQRRPQQSQDLFHDEAQVDDLVAWLFGAPEDHDAANELTCT